MRIQHPRIRIAYTLGFPVVVASTAIAEAAAVEVTRRPVFIRGATVTAKFTVAMSPAKCAARGMSNGDNFLPHGTGEIHHPPVRCTQFFTRRV